MNAASSRKRATNTATRIRLHRVGASNPALGVGGRGLQGEHHRHCQCRSPFVAVHNSDPFSSLIWQRFFSLSSDNLDSADEPYTKDHFSATGLWPLGSAHHWSN